jgi:hypothetical protein
MNLQRLRRKVSAIWQQGVARSARIILDKFALRLLQRLYGFNRWHADAPLSARPYRRTVAEIVNGLRLESVVEVGCGLGAVLSLVNARHRHGYDLDAGAIRAARLIRSRDIFFTQGDMSCVREHEIDVLILVNWIHDFSPEQLAIWLQPLIPRTRYLLLDAIDADNPLNYAFKHDFSFLLGTSKIVDEARTEGEGRRFLLFQVIH